MYKSISIILSAVVIVAMALPAIANEVVSTSSGAWFAVDARELKTTTLDGKPLRGGNEIELQSSANAWGEAGGGESATITWSDGTDSGVIAESSLARFFPWTLNPDGGDITLTYTSGSVTMQTVFKVLAKTSLRLLFF